MATKIFYLFLLSIVFADFSSLLAEIEAVDISWRPLNCQTNCPRLLEQQFRKIPGVQEISINPSTGHATLKWKPNSPFAYSSINVAMRLVGLSFTDLRLRVRGTLQYTHNTVTITSIGDNTRFDLLNPVIPEITKQAAQYNLEARRLKPALYQKLVDAAEKKQIATIEGPLFMPWRTPNELVVDQVSFTSPDDQKPQPQKR